MERTLDISDMLDAAALGRVLGVTRATIYKWSRENNLPSIRISRRCLRFEQDSVGRWLLERRKTCPAKLPQ